MPKIKIGKTSLYYEVKGGGKPLLLIAGLGSDSSSWFGVSGTLSRRFKVIVFDNPGTGRSSDMKKPFTIAHMADVVAEFLEYLKIKRANILGHSMGGYIAQELAVNYPECVDKLILESTAPVSSRRNEALFKNFYTQLKKEGCSKAWVERWAFWLFSRKLFADKSFIATFTKNVAEYPYVQKAVDFRSQIEAIASFDMRGELSAVKAKTLILEGKEDILITPEEAKALAKKIKRSTFLLLDSIAHCIHIENPKLFTGTVLKFLG
jgi:pimeloyl-ACP methyl ester carboxylesterase